MSDAKQETINLKKEGLYVTNQLRFTSGDLETGEFNLDVAIDSKEGPHWMQ
ncbi:hypothetical protein [Sporosarcina aquimarina]|uniref:hypothetical protein n=1 Tax=Sporosarcina aquimarina TaxID=114975 RepID=UPI00203B1E7B|nr:hypothetical protein [Sporosarcina aquimarina]